MVYKKADKVWHTPQFVLFFLKDSKDHKVAFVAGKKVGGSVQRNRAKRLLRAHFLNHIDTITPGSYIFVAKAKILDEDFATVDKDFVKALKRSGAMLSKR